METKQLPRLFRRGIVSPCSERTAAEMATWHVQGVLRVEWMPIDDAVFGAAWRAEIFQHLNRACSLSIDDYEEEVVDVRDLPRAIECLQSLNLAGQQLATEFARELTDFLITALKRSMPVYFIL
jgi:hypothetical protein